MAPVLAAALLSGTLLAAAGQLALKIGADGRVALADFVNPWIAAGLSAYGLGTLAWIWCLSRASLTTVYPFVGLTFVLVQLGGVLLLGERLDPRGLAGTALVLAGLALIMTQRA